jgi:hypothetical protein
LKFGREVNEGLQREFHTMGVDMTYVMRNPRVTPHLSLKQDRPCFLCRDVHPEIGKADKVNKLTNATACCVFTSSVFFLFLFRLVGLGMTVQGMLSCCLREQSLVDAYVLPSPVQSKARMPRNRVEF